MEANEIPSSGHFSLQENHKGVLIWVEVRTKLAGLVNQAGTDRNGRFYPWDMQSTNNYNFYLSLLLKHFITDVVSPS